MNAHSFVNALGPKTGGSTWERMQSSWRGSGGVRSRGRAGLHGREHRALRPYRLERLPKVLTGSRVPLIWLRCSDLRRGQACRPQKVKNLVAMGWNTGSAWRNSGRHPSKRDARGNACWASCKTEVHEAWQVGSPQREMTGLSYKKVRFPKALTGPRVPRNELPLRSLGPRTACKG